MFDLHTHSTASDGVLTPPQLVEFAIASGVAAMAITDHNLIHEDLDDLRKAYGDCIYLINGSEVSTLYATAQGDRIEVHIIALDFESEKMEWLMRSNRFDRRLYFKEFQTRLKAWGIDIPSYRDMLLLYPDHVIGRMEIADYMVRRGYCPDIDTAFDVYIGTFGARRAYVNALDFANFVPMDAAVKAIMDAGGIPVLAHPYSYHLEEAQVRQLARDFKAAAGNHPAGIEALYLRYSSQQKESLMQLADELELLYSTASDYHGRREGETLMHIPPFHPCRFDRLVAGHLSIPSQFRDKYYPRARS